MAAARPAAATIPHRNKYIRKHSDEQARHREQRRAAPSSSDKHCAWKTACPLRCLRVQEDSVDTHRAWSNGFQRHHIHGVHVHTDTRCTPFCEKDREACHAECKPLAKPWGITLHPDHPWARAPPGPRLVARKTAVTEQAGGETRQTWRQTVPSFSHHRSP